MLCSALPHAARAITELAATTDARSVGMGGTGTSFMHNAAAAVLNPGALQGIGQFAVNLMAEPGVGWQNAPAPSPTGPVQVDAERTFIPFFFVGAGFRVHERVVVALAVHPTVGFASTYNNAAALGGADLSASVSSMEGTAAVSVRLLDNLSIGAGYRVTYSMFNANQPDFSSGALVRNEMELSGWNALGARVGLHYAPTPSVKLGLTYTSKVTTKLDGSAKMVLPVGDPLKFDARQDLASPHGLRLGGSVALLDDKLLLALDLKTLFYAESNKESVTVIEDVPNPANPTMTLDQRAVVKQNWKNVYAGGLGAEYKVMDALALRLGYSVTNSATPKSTASLIGMGPGIVNAFHAGVGVQALPSLNLDLGAFYAFVSSEVPETKPNGGQYEMALVVGALSATYHR